MNNRRCRRCNDVYRVDNNAWSLECVMHPGRLQPGTLTYACCGREQVVFDGRKRMRDGCTPCVHDLVIDERGLRVDAQHPFSLLAPYAHLGLAAVPRDVVDDAPWSWRAERVVRTVYDPATMKDVMEHGIQVVYGDGVEYTVPVGRVKDVDEYAALGDTDVGYRLPLKAGSGSQFQVDTMDATTALREPFAVVRVIGRTQVFKEQ